MRAVENEERLDRQCEEAEEAVVECAEGRVITTTGALNLKLPDGDVNCYSEWSVVLLEVLDGEFGEGGSLAEAELLVDTTKVSAWQPVWFLKGEVPRYTHIGI